jgi:hypothetical protein
MDTLNQASYNKLGFVINFEVKVNYSALLIMAVDSWIKCQLGQEIFFFNYIVA